MQSVNNFKVFLVDDDKMFLKSLEHNVCKFFPDIKIKTFLTGEECLNNLSDPPDAIVLDYFLPGINGLSAFKKIKESLPKMPIILLSNNKEENTIQRLIAEGVYEYIIKTRYCINGLKFSLGNIIENKNNNSTENKDNYNNDYILFFQDIGGEA